MEDVNKLRRNFIFLSEPEYGPFVFNLRRIGVHLRKWVRKIEAPEDCKFTV